LCRQKEWLSFVADEFTASAAGGKWSTVHLGQFIGTTVMIARLLVLFFALGVAQGTPRWLGFFTAVSAGVALALTGVVYAVDGVTLKQAADAWVSAPAAEQAERFAIAEAILWLEWGSEAIRASCSVSRWCCSPSPSLGRRELLGRLATVWNCWAWP
jgi:hypothetical protein